MPDTNVMPAPSVERVRARVTEVEWQARLDCAAAYRLMAALRDERPDLQPHHGAHPRRGNITC